MASSHSSSVTVSQFVKQYYEVLQHQPELAHRFYTASSTIIRVDGQSTQTATDISEKDKSYMVMNDIFHFVTKKDSSAAKRPLEIFANWHMDPKDTTGVKIEADSFEPWMNQTISFPVIRVNDYRDDPVVITATIAGHFIQGIYIANGSESEIMYEHCFLQLDENIRRKLIEDTSPLVGALGEVVRPLGRIQLPVIIGDGGRFRKLEMTFLVIRSPRSTPNVIIGHSGLCALRAVVSINHGAIKFPTPSGIATIFSPSDDERIHQA